MTKEFISRKTAANFQKTTSQFAPRPFATPQPKSAKTENSTPQDIQCSPESSNRLSRIAITQPETFTPQLTVQRAEQAQVANDNPGEGAEKIQRSSTGNNRLAKISIHPPEPPSTPRFPIQAKLTVGAGGDRYEQEADRVAQQVVNRIHAPQVNLNSSESNPVQRKISIQAFGGEGGDVSSEWESQLNQARGGGQPLSPSLREPMEREFGADFSGVRVHTGAQADSLARSIQAKAFTTGQDVFFRQGAYEPGSRGGQELIAHELTHVVQQSGETATRIQRNKKHKQTEQLNHKEEATKVVKKVHSLAPKVVDVGTPAIGSGPNVPIIQPFIPPIGDGLGVNGTRHHIYPKSKLAMAAFAVSKFLKAGNIIINRLNDVNEPSYTDKLPVKEKVRNEMFIYGTTIITYGSLIFDPTP
ncbi:DUF4157 domain-containing protein [Laspinema sp. D1]|uniref:eCIS core domain-containing protein n=1 Tax=Laspinema palackyanum TaxID=3231601 RepID=UPI003486E229|nr:DUF4157 domain-containing protein [Laspinema sp. D2b]